MIMIISGVILTWTFLFDKYLFGHMVSHPWTKSQFIFHNHMNAFHVKFFTF